MTISLYETVRMIHENGKRLAMYRRGVDVGKYISAAGAERIRQEIREDLATVRETLESGVQFTVEGVLK